MHAYAFLIRETKISRRFARFSNRIFMGACNQGGKVLEFYGGVVTRRHSFGFSRNNMKGALNHWENLNECEPPKMGNFQFSNFVVMGFKGRTPCKVIEACNEVEGSLCILAFKIQKSTSIFERIEKVGKCTLTKENLNRHIHYISEHKHICDIQVWTGTPLDPLQRPALPQMKKSFLQW